MADNEQRGQQAERVRDWWGEKRDDSPTESQRKAVLKELDTLLNTPTVMERALREEFRLNAKDVHLFCDWETARECAAHCPTKNPCRRLHFRIIANHRTQMSRGNCSFLDHCFHQNHCKAIHYDVDQHDLRRISKQLQHKKKITKQRPDLGVRLDLSVFQTFPPQWIQCDVRFIDFSALGKFSVILADPPWRINMELPYGTMGDEEMRRLPVPQLQDHGVIFLWVTSRATRLGHELLRLWGYEHVNDLVWIKINQLQSLVRTGRTGHWMNHAKEHCMIGIKGNPSGIYPGMDCDVLVSEVRDTSRKPDELYGLIERLSPGTPKIELFGRRHNVQKNWLTLGDQLPGVHLEDEGLIQRFKKRYPYTPEETLSLLLHNQFPRKFTSPSSSSSATAAVAAAAAGGTSRSPEHRRRDRRHVPVRANQYRATRGGRGRAGDSAARTWATRHDTQGHARAARAQSRGACESRRSPTRRRSRERSPLRHRTRETGHGSDATTGARSRSRSVDAGRGGATARYSDSAGPDRHSRPARERGEVRDKGRGGGRGAVSNDSFGEPRLRAQSTSVDRWARTPASSSSAAASGRLTDVSATEPLAEDTEDRIAQLQATLRAGFGPRHLAVHQGNVGYWKKDRHGKGIFIRVVVSRTEADNITARWNALQDELSGLVKSPHSEHRDAQKGDAKRCQNRYQRRQQGPPPRRSLSPTRHVRAASEHRGPHRPRHHKGRGRRDGASGDEERHSDGATAIVSTGDSNAIITDPTPTMSAQDLRNLWG